jgi:hypothetical protein
MQDLIVIVMIIGFFGLCLALVAGCSRILGPAVVDTPDHPVLDTGTASDGSRPAAIRGEA